VRNTPITAVFAFCLHLIPKIKNVGIDLYEDDVLYNIVTTESQLMNGTIPEKGLKEKDPLFLQMLIEASTKVGDIILDCSTTKSKLLPLRFFIFSINFIMQFHWYGCHIF
jgi:hypothetical protein